MKHSKNWHYRIDDGFANDKPMADVMEEAYQEGVNEGKAKVISILFSLDRQMATLVESVVRSKK